MGVEHSRLVELLGLDRVDFSEKVSLGAELNVLKVD